MAKTKTGELTEQEKNILRIAVRRTWDQIARDIFDSNGGTTMTRAEVIEATCDSDYPLHYGMGYTYRGGKVSFGDRRMTPKEFEELYREKFFPFMLKQTDKEAEEFFAPVFPHKRYGI